MSEAVIAQGIGKEISSADTPLSILEDISLQIETAESAAIVGPSGAGKTTLLSLLAGLDLPSRGEIWLAGENITAMDEEGRARFRAGRVGFVFQSFQLLSGFSALENVLLSAELARVANPERAARQCLDEVGLSARIGHYPQQLSGGEQQRVALARAFAGRPSILFADEPTGNLDAVTGDHIIELLFGLNQQHGTTLILVTHDQKLATRCDRTLALTAGRLDPAAAAA